MLARNKNKFALFGILLFSSLFSTAIFSNAAMAHCPLCTLATGAAVATARWYGVDDLIVSTFIGGTIISTGYESRVKQKDGRVEAARSDLVQWKKILIQSKDNMKSNHRV